LAQELSDGNPKLRKKMSEYFDFWALELGRYLESARKREYFKKEFKPRESAQSILSLYEGAILFCKASKNPGALQNAGRMAGAYLRAYRP